MNKRASTVFQKWAALKAEVALQPHQQRVVDRVQSGDKRLLLYHGLGTGKSLSSLAAAESLGNNYGVVVPAALRPNYQKEVDRFTEGSTPEIMSYNGVGAGKQFKTPPDTYIFDEAHRLRNPGTAGAQAASQLSAKAKNLLLLTGTPITNSPTDLAPLLSMLRKENITPEQFAQDYIGHRKVYPTWLSHLTGRGVGEEPYVKNEDQLREKLKGLIDYQPGKAPEGVNVDEQVVRVPISDAQEQLQQAIRDQMPPEFKWKLDKEFPLTRAELSRMNAFSTGLRQSSLSTLTFRGDRDPLKAFDESSKLQRAFGDLQETLKSDPRKKGLIYSNYIEAGLGPYAAALDRAKIPYGMYHGSMSVDERNKALSGYNEGKLKALLLGPAAAEGISTKGTSLIQLLDPHWHESRGRQAEGRGLRFDSHEGLPPELKNVAIRRYLSSSSDPSFLGSLLGSRRQRTGDEILERLAANKEQLNNQFRKILQEEGTTVKQSSIALLAIKAASVPNLVTVPIGAGLGGLAGLVGHTGYDYIFPERNKAKRKSERVAAIGAGIGFGLMAGNRVALGLNRDARNARLGGGSSSGGGSSAGSSAPPQSTTTESGSKSKTWFSESLKQKPQDKTQELEEYSQRKEQGLPTGEAPTITMEDMVRMNLEEAKRRRGK